MARGTYVQAFNFPNNTARFTFCTRHIPSKKKGRERGKDEDHTGSKGDKMLHGLNEKFGFYCGYFYLYFYR